MPFKFSVKTRRLKACGSLLQGFASFRPSRPEQVGVERSSMLHAHLSCRMRCMLNGEGYVPAFAKVLEDGQLRGLGEVWRPGCRGWQSGLDFVGGRLLPCPGAVAKT